MNDKINYKVLVVPQRQSKRWLCNNITDLWKSKFFHGGEWDSEEYYQIYLKLIDACPRPSKETIDRIIGNSTWTENICHVCGEDKEELTSYRYWGTNEVVFQQCKECAEICNAPEKPPEKDVLTRYFEYVEELGLCAEKAANKIKISRRLFFYYQKGERYPSEEIEKRMLEVMGIEEANTREDSE